MKSSKVFVKRSQSPSQPPKTIQISDRKKKSSSNTHLQSNHPKKQLKQFDTYGKTTQKKRNNYLKQLLKTNNEQTNKYRIVTEPVQQRLLYLGNNNYGNTNTNTNTNTVNNNIMKNSSAVIKLPSKSKIQPQHNHKNIQPQHNHKNQQHNHKNQYHHHQYTQKYLKLNIRTTQNSKQKIKTGESFHKGEITNCKNCQKYSINYHNYRFRQQLEYYKKQLNKICMDKILWKSGQMHIDDVKESFFRLKDKTRIQSLMTGNSQVSQTRVNSKIEQTRGNSNSQNKQQRHKTSTNSVQKQRQYGIEYGRGVKQQLFTYNNDDDYYNKYRSPSQQQQQLSQIKQLPSQLPYTKIIDKQLAQIKKHILDLMNDIQSLSAIDYPKMLSLNIFKYDPFYVQNPSTQQLQLKHLLTQLRTSMQGKVTDQDLIDVFNNNEMNQHNRMIFRNLKNRLNHYLRQNLQLKIRKQVLQKSQQITKQSQDYLKKVIQNVLLTYIDAIDGSAEQ